MVIFTTPSKSCPKTEACLHSVNHSIVTTMTTTRSINPPVGSLEKHALFSKGPQSFLKYLFIGNKLGEALKKMTLSKTVPDGLKPQESEVEVAV